MSKPSASDPRAGTSQTLLSKRAHLFDIRVNLQVAADFPVSLSSDDIRDEKVIKQNEFPNIICMVHVFVVLNSTLRSRLFAA